MDRNDALGGVLLQKGDFIMNENKNINKFWLKVLLPIIVFCICIGAYQCLKQIRIKTCIISIREDAEYEIEREGAEDYIEADVHINNIGVMGFIIDCDYKIKGTNIVGDTRTYSRGVIGSTPTKSGQITTVLWVILVSGVISSEAFIITKNFGWNKIIAGFASVVLICGCLFGSALGYRYKKITDMVSNAYESMDEEKEKSQYDGLAFETHVDTEIVSFWKIKVTIKVKTTDTSTGTSADYDDENIYDICPWQ